jgi:hypothetical protein
MSCPCSSRSIWALMYNFNIRSFIFGTPQSEIFQLGWMPEPKGN